MTKKSYITVTDQFCGAGGSSIGATAAGAELSLAMNHWSLAVETHNSNFPDALHDCADMSSVNPRRYPATDILITSPECTNHSIAKGKKRKSFRQLSMFGSPAIDPAAERSRATMWDVPRFAEAHRYNIIIVENVNAAGSSINDALPTLTTVDRHALVMPFVVNMQANNQPTPITDPLPTQLTGNHRYLALPEGKPSVEDCGFRMLQPHEIQKAMAFPEEYVVLGTQREKVKQLGNAVTPPVMEMLIQRCIETLH